VTTTQTETRRPGRFSSRTHLTDDDLFGGYTSLHTTGDYAGTTYGHIEFLTGLELQACDPAVFDRIAEIAQQIAAAMREGRDSVVSL